MAALVFHHGPNRFITSETPGNTSWNLLPRPSALPPASGNVNLNVAICTLAAAGGAGSYALLAFDQATTPSVGWPLLTTEVFAMNANIYYQLTTSTDTIYFLFSW